MINEIFQNIDRIFKELETKSKEYNKDTWHSTNSIDEYCHIDNAIPTTEELNPFGIPYIWREKDTSKNYSKFFMFRTEAEYMNRSLTEQFILENSELRKCFYNDDNVEIGLTIEEGLNRPTDTHWGFSFSKPKYYIIKNNNIKISESRATIRKVYYDKNTEKEYNLIRLDDTLKDYSREINNINKLYDGVYSAEIDYEDCIIYKDEKDLVYYCTDLMKEEMKYTKDNIIALYGSVEEIFERIVDGTSCSIETMLFHNMDFCLDYLNLTPIEYGDNPITVTFCDVNIDSDINLNGYNVIYNKN
jgi:hypothetical protein